MPDMGKPRTKNRPYRGSVYCLMMEMLMMARRRELEKENPA